MLKPPIHTEKLKKYWMDGRTDGLTMRVVESRARDLKERKEKNKKFVLWGIILGSKREIPS